MNIRTCLKPNSIITTVVQLSLPLAVYLAIISNSSWLWWATAFFFYTIVYTMIGNNIAFHRYFTHKQFEVSRPVRWLFLWAGSMGGIGDPISYSTTHLVHHKYSDTDQDPHGPVRGWRSVMYCFYKRVSPKDTPIVGRRIIELMRAYGWVHTYYLLFLLVNIGIMLLLGYKIFLFCWLLPASAFTWNLSIAVLLQHRNFKPNNHWIERYIPWYEGLHANHHVMPGVGNTAFNPGEIDYTYHFSKIFRPVYAQHTDS